MTSNGSEEVNQSQNQTSKVQNGMKCADSMPSTLNTARRSNRNNNMGLKRVRSVDSIAGMCHIYLLILQTISHHMCQVKLNQTLIIQNVKAHMLQN